MFPPFLSLLFQCLPKTIIIPQKTLTLILELELSSFLTASPVIANLLPSLVLLGVAATFFAGVAAFFTVGVCDLDLADEEERDFERELERVAAGEGERAMLLCRVYAELCCICIMYYIIV